MQTSCWLYSFLEVLLVSGCFCASAYPDSPDRGAMAELVSANNVFGFKVLEKLLERQSESNVFISPTSLAMALNMTYNGADGETREAMAEALELEGMSLEEVNQASAALMARLEHLDEDILLDIANSLWARKGTGFRSDFLKRNEEFYEAEVREMDFSDPGAPSVINAWVKEKTRGKIEEIIEKITKDDILFLINAVYFKGIWTVKFDEKYTQERDFTLLDGGKKKMMFMTSQSKSFKHLWTDKFQAVSLPYGDGKVSMYVFLPHRESSLKALYEDMNSANWDDWMSPFASQTPTPPPKTRMSQFRQPEVMVIMPRLQMEYEIALNGVLSELGMGIAFGSGADFGGMCSGNVFIDEVRQKTYLEVNEEGTEAAAVASVRMKKGGVRVMVVDRPFFCAIRDNETGAILFMGSVVEP